MDVCSVCKRKFLYKEILKSQCNLGSLTCPKCSTKYVLTKLSRLISSVIIIFPFLLINVSISYIGVTYTVLIYIFWFLLTLFVCPLFYGYTKGD